MPFRRSMCKAIGLVVALLTAIAARGEPLEFKAASESLNLGVARYLVDRSGQTLDIRAIDAKSNQLATITARLGTPDGISMEVQAGTDDLLITWDYSSGHFSLHDNVTGEAFSGTPTSVHPPTYTAEGKQSLVVQHQQLVQLALTAIDENLTNLGLHPRFPSYSSRSSKSSGKSCPVPRSSPFASPKDASDCPPGCGGPIVDGGLQGATSRTLACNAATQAVENQCTNGYCYGCCRILGCDCQCIPGTDFACVCDAEGQTCSPPPDSCSGDGGGDGGGTGGGGGGGCRGPGGVCLAECFACSDVAPRTSPNF